MGSNSGKYVRERFDETPWMGQAFRVNIIILGAGEIGLHMAGLLCDLDHNVSLIEKDEQVAAEANDKLDARIVEGNGASVSILEEAGVSECDTFFGLSSSGSTNIVAASLAKALGAKKAVCRVHPDVQQEQWLFDFRTRFDVDHLFSSERLAAVELAKFIRNPDCLVVEEIARGRIELQQTLLPPGSPGVGKTLKELKLPTRVRVGSIQRDGRSIIPDGDETLQAGDVVTLFGASRALEDLAPLFRATRRENDEVRVVIFGGGGYGFALAQMLEGSERYRTRIFERDPKRCAFLSSVLQRTTLINADATSANQLREEQVGDADFFVGATTDDEDNVMTCLQARHLGVKHGLTIVHRADYADAVMRAGPQLGILGAISPRVATGRDLIRFATSDKLHSLLTLEGGVEVVEFSIRPGSRLAGKKVTDVEWPKGCGLVSLTHGSSATVPAAGDALAAGDVVAAMVAPGSKKKLEALID